MASERKRLSSYLVGRSLPGGTLRATDKGAEERRSSLAAFLVGGGEVARNVPTGVGDAAELMLLANSLRDPQFRKALQENPLKYVPKEQRNPIGQPASGFLLSPNEAQQQAAFAVMPLMTKPLVTRHGKPVTVYHASHRKPDFERGVRGPVFFAEKPRNAEFGKVTTKAQLRMKRPLDAEFGSIDKYEVDEILAQMPKKEIASVVDDIVSVDDRLADELENLNGDKYQFLFDLMAGEIDDPTMMIYQDARIHPAIKRAGFDGIIGTDTFGGEREYIVFDSDQIVPVVFDEDAIKIKKAE